jgi:hypothetical protein
MDIELDATFKKLLEKYNINFEKDSIDYKKVFLVYGDKGVGKTSFALMFPGNIVAFSFDGQTRIIKKRLSQIYPEKANSIKVYDMDQVYYGDNLNNTREDILSSSEILLTFMKKIVTSTHPDWFLVDGSSEYVTMAEYVMRKNNGLLPFQGIANQNLWKERNVYIRQLHNTMISNARFGVIYTGWEQLVEVEDEGELRKLTIPKWTDIIMQKTQFIVRIVRTTVKSGNGQKVNKYFAKIVSSKDDDFLPTGAVFDITNYTSIPQIQALSSQIQKEQQTVAKPKEDTQKTEEIEKQKVEVNTQPVKNETETDFFDDI